MQYRTFGNTGVRISALGFGCMRLPEIEENGVFTVDQEKTNRMLRRAVELGVNYFDTAFYYCHENSEIAVGKALAPIRDRVMISTKCPMERVHSKADYRALLMASLQKLGTGYVDFYHFWGIGRQEFDETVMGLDLISEAKKLKEEGLIRHISFSFHDEPAAIRHIIDTAPELETMLVQYNLLDRSNEEMIAYAARKGLGVAVMGPVGGGRLAAPAGLYGRLTGTKSRATYELALRFVLGNPHVSCALSGMQTDEMVANNAAVASRSDALSPAEWQTIADSMENLKKFSELYCTGCRYCQPCPKNIDIPALFQAYTYHNVYGLSAAAKTAYENYRKDGKKGLAADCAGCGLCEKKCPQHIKVREELRRVESVLAAL